MQIQQSHFFTVDLFVNAFAFLALWFAVAILEYKGQGIGNKEQGQIGDVVEEEVASKEELGVAESPGEASEVDAQPAAVSALQTSISLNTSYFLLILRNPLFLLSLGFGFALGMAMASKINIAPLAIVLPGAFVLRYLITKKRKSGHSPTTGSWKLTTDLNWTLVIVCLIAGGLATLISFRIFQPYAFDGIGLNPQWVANIKEQRVQAKGDADLPWNLQWARRSHLYSFDELDALGTWVFRWAFLPGQVSSTWAGASSKASGVTRCSGAGQRSISSGNRFSSIPPCAISCRSIRCLR